MLDDQDNHHNRHPEPNQPDTSKSTPTPRVLTVLSSVLDKLVARNDQLAVSSVHVGNSLNAFHSARAPSISIINYLERLYKYTNCSASCFIVGYVYIDRVIHRHPDSLVGSLNVHRLLITSILIASKMLDDEHYNNAFFARVGGVGCDELNRLELELLFLLDFGVMVNYSVFERYCFHLEKEMIFDDSAVLRIEKPLNSKVLEEVNDLVPLKAAGQSSLIASNGGLI